MPRTLIVGDIHGCHAELLDLLDVVGLDPEDTLVSVGDLVDRGPDPGPVVELFRARPNSVVLMGNHERKHVRGVFSYSQHVARLQMGERYAEQVAWMAGLPYSYETDAVRVVHWGCFPGVPLAHTPEDVLAGTTSGDAKLRERYGETAWFEHYTDDKPIVFGHAVFPEPLVRRDRVFGIDTGACHGLRLTGLLLPELRLVSVPARADHWARVRSEWQEPVLRVHPWRATPFDAIAKKVRSLRDPDLPSAFLDGVERWAEALRGAIPSLADRLEGELARLEAEVPPDEVGRVAAAHPAASWIHRYRAGRLSRAHLGCTTPEHVFRLAEALGAPLPVGAEP